MLYVGRRCTVVWAVLNSSRKRTNRITWTTVSRPWPIHSHNMLPRVPFGIPRMQKYPYISDECDSRPVRDL